ncbi:thymidylate kinase [Mycobacterium phage I3]|uniref:NadR/Ttd14 AAA domain-containing protein n=1 Tax=Mycobacterium phage I3 TaxID=2994057 RepID=A0A8F2IWS3_9CAUD|nr:thymidylate kinase [Mycobacterium phage I3]QWT30450.1 hypothetical protein PBI_I3_207 [Mycobacterium phage I3]
MGAAYGMANNMDGDWQFQFQVIAETRLRQWEAEHQLMNQASVPWDRPRLLLADRCAIDPVCYTTDLVDRARAARLGRPLIAFTDRDYTFLHLVRDMGQDLATRDVEEFWDIVALKPPHPDHLVGDADRLDDRQYQADVDKIARKVYGEIVAATKVNSIVLDPDRDVAAEELWEVIRDESARRRAT